MGAQTYVALTFCHLCVSGANKRHIADYRIKQISFLVSLAINDYEYVFTDKTLL